MEPPVATCTPVRRSLPMAAVALHSMQRRPHSTQSLEDQIARLKEANERLLRNYKEALDNAQFFASILGFSDVLEARTSLEMMEATPGLIDYSELADRIRSPAHNEPKAEVERLEEEMKLKEEEIQICHSEIKRSRDVGQRALNLESSLAAVSEELAVLKSQHDELLGKRQAELSSMQLREKQFQKHYTQWKDFRNQLLGSETAKRLGRKGFQRRLEALVFTPNADAPLSPVESPPVASPSSIIAQSSIITSTGADDDTVVKQTPPRSSARLSSPTTLVNSSLAPLARTKVLPASPTKQLSDKTRPLVLTSSPRSPFRTPGRRQALTSRGLTSSRRRNKENTSPRNRTQQQGDDIISIESSPAIDRTILLSPSRKHFSPYKAHPSLRRTMSFTGASSETEEESQPPLVLNLFPSLRRTTSASPVKSPKRTARKPLKQAMLPMKNEGQRGTPVTSPHTARKIPSAMLSTRTHEVDSVAMDVGKMHEGSKLSPKRTRHSDIGIRGSRTEEPIAKRRKLSLDTPTPATASSICAKGKQKATETKDYSVFKGRGRYAQNSTPSSEKTINSGFMIDTSKNGGLGHQYDEVVRRKNDRRNLHGEDCDCCRNYYEAVGPLPIRLQPPLWASPKKDGNKRTRDREGGSPSRVKDESILAHKQSVSRHRARWNRAPTPPGYWNIGFPSTQEVEGINEKAREMREKKMQEVERDVRRGDGVWIRRT